MEPIRLANHRLPESRLTNTTHNTHHKMPRHTAQSAAFFFLILTAQLHAETKVYFSPHGGAENAITAQIHTAAHIIRIQAYHLSSQPIADALITAIHRGVTVTVIIDKTGYASPYCQANRLLNNHATIVIDAPHSIAHNKIIIIDDTTLITGSYNFTKQADQNNAENLLIIDDAKIINLYIANWTNHLNHSLRIIKTPTRTKQRTNGRI